MIPDWPFDDRTALAPPAYLEGLGRVFARFDLRTQDSGNISFGLETGGRRWFVKTAGEPDNPKPYLNHADRIGLLENAQRIARVLEHPAGMPHLHGVVPSAWGPMLVYDWVDGELLHTPADRREDPSSSAAALPAPSRRKRSRPPSTGSSTCMRACAARAGSPATSTTAA